MCRFLDAQRIHSLTRYLEQLHDCGLGGADHTTLLLNCYTKLKDLKKLDKFIHRDDRGGSGEGGGSAVAANLAVLSAAANAARREHPKDEGKCRVVCTLDCCYGQRPFSAAPETSMKSVPE